VKATAVPLARAISKLGIASRTQAINAILAGRVTVRGRVVTNPGHPVNPETARIAIDGETSRQADWRTVLLHKPRGVVTTRRDPEGRRTVYDVLDGMGVKGDQRSQGDQGAGTVAWLAPVGRLDAATSGLLLLTNDTKLADWLMDPANAVVRVYRVTVRGRVTDDDVERLQAGISERGQLLRAEDVTIRKASGRETHLIVRLTEGKNREIRRMFTAIGHEVTALARVAIGSLELGTLKTGDWREVSREEMRKAFPAASMRR
jgi:23S rRNA pseudouridine2605 synthase